MKIKNTHVKQIVLYNVKNCIWMSTSSYVNCKIILTSNDKNKSTWDNLNHIRYLLQNQICKVVIDSSEDIELV